MSRILCLALSVLLAIPLAGCEGQAAQVPSEDPAPAVQSAEAAPAGGETELSDVSEAPPEDPEPEPEPEPEEPYVRVIDPSAPMVALTFDDGPDPTYTAQILEVLEKNHAVATFFEVGRNISLCPEVLVQARDQGCELASHSNAHKDLSKMKKSAVLQDLQTADNAFIAAGVDAPLLVRPPYGATNKTVKYGTEKAMITWTVDTYDWESQDAETVSNYIQSLPDLDGEIVLMHSLYGSTVEALETVLPWLTEQGYQTVTVTELMAYYYGELPQPGQFYGYTYFTTHGRTDAPLSLEPPAEEVPAEEVPAEELPEEAAPAEEAAPDVSAQ